MSWMIMEDIKEKCEKAIKQILRDEGWELYPQLPMFCLVRQRIPTEIDIKLTVVAHRPQQEKKRRFKRGKKKRT